eukprot:5249939-Alexandrium_andersonii.AAC.1
MRGRQLLGGVHPPRLHRGRNARLSAAGVAQHPADLAAAARLPRADAAASSAGPAPQAQEDPWPAC